MKIFMILAVCIAVASAGVVDHTRCGKQALLLNYVCIFKNYMLIVQGELGPFSR